MSESAIDEVELDGMLDQDIFDYALGSFMEDYTLRKIGGIVSRRVSAVGSSYACRPPDSEGNYTKHIDACPTEQGNFYVLVPWLIGLHFSLFVLVMKPDGRTDVHHIDSLPGNHKLCNACGDLNKIATAIRDRDAVLQRRIRRASKGGGGRIMAKNYWKIGAGALSPTAQAAPRQTDVVSCGLHALLHAKSILAHLDEGKEMNEWMPTWQSQDVMDKKVAEFRQRLVAECRAQEVYYPDYSVGFTT